jgi:succinate dehydrogenase / fumarate reductase cytochrome b subunit
MTGSTKNTNYLLGSSIGRKFLMGLTGLFLVTFLLVHCFINAMVFFDGTGALFNDYAHFMGTNIIIRIMEVGLFGGLLAHIIDGLWLWKLNNDARPEKYAYSQPNANSKWYSRSMGLLGTLLLIFLIIHLAHFWVPSRITGLAEIAVPGVHDLYAEMFTVFANPIVVAIYVLAQFSLGFHLLHGFQSAFQSLGLNHTKYNALIKTVGVGYSILIPFIFALMPIVIYLRH